MALRTMAVACLLVLSACTSGSDDAADSTVLAETTTTSTTQPSSTQPVTTAATTTTTEENGDADSPVPSHSDAQVLQLAADLGVDRLLVSDGADYVAVSDGVAARASRPGWVWSDGNYLYWRDSNYDEDSGDSEFVASYAATFDWTVVCSFDEWNIHHVTERPDGSLVAGVERPWELSPEPDYSDDLAEVPAFAAECSDGTTQPIAAFRGYGGESGYWGVDRIAGRVFSYEGDAEGNIAVQNEAGLLLTGDDIVGGTLDYSDDGSSMVYGIHIGGWAAAPAMSIRKRDTTSGDVIWTLEIDSPVTSLDYAEDAVIVGLFPMDEFWDGATISTDRVLILDASTADSIGEVRTDLSVHYAG